MTHAQFSAGWLDQREPFDAVARKTAEARLRLPEWLAQQRGEPNRIIDLGCGTGANFRQLAPQLGHGQQWLVVDHDAALLARWPELLKPWAAARHARSRSDATGLHIEAESFSACVVRRRADLASELESLPLHAATLLTASALLDLVSADWLQRLVALAMPARPAWLFTLSVVARPRWLPRDRHDARAADLFRAHQRRDKGFGPALGPDAADALRALLLDAGCTLRTARSDWVTGPDGAGVALQRALLDGIAAAAIEQQPDAAALLQAWQLRRSALAAQSALRIPHVDLLAFPRRSRSHSMSSPSR